METSEKSLSCDSRREPGPGRTVDRFLRPDDCILILIDFQARLASTIDSMRVDLLVKNAVDLAKTARIFNIPTVLTTIGENDFGGPVIAQIQEVFPDQEPIDRSGMIVFEDEAILSQVEKVGRNKLIMAGLWTDFCVATSAIRALHQGYEVCIVVDASGDVSLRTHETALQQMARSGVIPMTWLQVLLELQSGMADRETFTVLLDAAREHARLYGLNLHAHPAIAYGRTKEGKAFSLFEKNWGHGGTHSSYKTDR